MPAFLIGLLVLGVAEVWVFVQVAHAVSGIGALALLVLSMILGGRLVRVEGARTVRHLQQASVRGAGAGVAGLPAREVVDGALVAVGGLLLVVPGFVTTAVGLVLVLPFTRPLVRALALRGVGRRLGRSVVVRVAGSGAATRFARGRVVDGEVVDVPPPRRPPRRLGR